MTAPNRATLWGRTLVDELAAGGLEAVCLAPGSRSTPLTVAFAEHPEIETYSHLDERSAAFFALGRARRTGEPTALVCTSGTAAANFHPAVIEASQARVPLLVLTADRPPELRDSGANQTVDQVKLYGDAVRWYVELPVPKPDERALRSLRTTAARALARTSGIPAGPVHLNCPFRKPLEPTRVPDAVPEGLEDTLAGRGRDGPFVRVSTGETTSTEDSRTPERIARALEDAARPLIVAGPADPPVRKLATSAVVDLATAVGAPIFADPLSTLRFGSHLETPDEDEPVVYGGYDTYVEAVPDPDAVIRFGASPTSKPLRHALRDADCRQFLVDPAGEWREATFTASDLVVSEPTSLFEAVSSELETETARARVDDAWLETLAAAEAHHWAVSTSGRADLESAPFEGAILATVFEAAPDPSTVFVSNSMPIRDANRFGEPRDADLTVLANRGASGIDGIVSTALGAGSATDDPLVLVTGDLALYHDSNGLLALKRCGVDATIVLLDNDGGGIFHKLPIESFDPPFTEQFRTPHGLEFDPLGELYGFDVRHVAPDKFEDAYRESFATSGTQLLSVSFDAEASHRRREVLEGRVLEAVRDLE
ncbi:2-succinyl-5-enolpyruvyl-6-hydroxy-3-cyclohexene-1-carboxylic-acid synthase [Natronosalvus rutilus]|uniref:2-succinyl-5-enolpyruvyl-6-hydroxy-3-cyclohexene-1-carboxylate synthase n=1 Tax=Natronosalvus rutilus TaxID=2953753 RepID=A0A9E7SVI8_9EURY|nr:2-succinyl-5-enolpyruvyl-6-hydroxy-3-cyclohexene-1-carboxylic-acid synthase [Natronosalvus rutilus]UTF53051.1 2-succinyl-5-enolpyruvyl-6-hydroxy-3-cyclohexene-1-carboxylic-acid synthase [Natronosalvus rutilus]